VLRSRCAQSGPLRNEEIVRLFRESCRPACAGGAAEVAFSGPRARSHSSVFRHLVIRCAPWRATWMRCSRSRGRQRRLRHRGDREFERGTITTRWIVPDSRCISAASGAAHPSLPDGKMDALRAWYGVLAQPGAGAVPRLARCASAGRRAGVSASNAEGARRARDEQGTRRSRETAAEVYGLNILVREIEDAPTMPRGSGAGRKLLRPMRGSHHAAAVGRRHTGARCAASLLEPLARTASA